jgi:hypothetical protein
MLIEIIDADASRGQIFSTGDVIAQDGEAVARWYYFSNDGVIEIWFEPDKLFIDLLSHSEILFLERMITREIEQYEKDQAEIDSICIGV